MTEHPSTGEPAPELDQLGSAQDLAAAIATPPPRRRATSALLDQHIADALAGRL
jgi:hypothetical protein